MKKLNKISIFLVTLFSLVGCKNDMSDLDRYFADIKAIPPKQIEPLPEINSPEVFQYDAFDLRDPFSNDLQLNDPTQPKVDPSITGEGPDLNRRKEILENFPLDGLFMVGTYKQANSFWGIVEDPEGDIYRVSLGQYIGQNYGEILAINEDEIQVSEWLPDGLGGWRKREAAIALRDEE